jgi:hypothetical protein
MPPTYQEIIPVTSLHARLWVTLCSWLLACGLSFAQQIVVERDSALHAEPSPAAAVIGTLKRGTPGQATTKKGPWLNVKTSAGSGWVLSFNVRFGPAQSNAGDTSALGRVVGPRQQLNVTSTIGVRGIDSEALRQARFDEQQIQMLEKNRTTPEQAKASAAASGLKAVQVEYAQ